MKASLFSRSIKLLAALLLILSVTDYKAQCTAAYTYTAGPNGSYLFTSTSSTVTTATTYYWNFGNSTTYSAVGAAGATAAVTYTANGSYVVNLFFTTPPTCSNAINQTITVVSAPTCAIIYTSTAATASLCNGSASVTGIVGLCAPSYTWVPGNMTGSSVSNLCPGVYTVIALSSNTTCCPSATAVVSIPSASCGLTASFVPTYSANGTVIFNNTSTGTISGTTYTWNFGDNSTPSNAVSPVHTYSANGTYAATLTASNNSLSCVSTKTMNIVVSSYCTLAAGFTYSIGANGYVSFLNTTTPTVSVTYTWSLGNSTTSFSASPAITYSANGVYTVNLLAYSSSGCTSTASAVITITNVCNIQANFTASQGSNGLVNFNNTSTGTLSGATYTWSFGDSSAPSTLVSPAHTYSANGTYVATLTASTPSGCVNTKTLSITVNSYCTLSAGFTYAYGANGSVTFSNTTTPSAASYTWSFGNSTVSTAINPSTTYTSNGTYSVVLLASSSSSLSPCTSTFMAVITITNVCSLNANFTFTQVANGTYSFINTSTGTSSTTAYNWQFGDGGTSTALNPSHTYTATGAYVMTLTASNGSACVSGKILTITVNCNLVASFIYSVQSQGQVSFTSTSTGTNSSSTYSWTFDYPGTAGSALMNPSHTYTSAGVKQVHLSVYNSSPGCWDSSIVSISVPTFSCLVNAAFTHTTGTSGQVSFSSASTGTLSSSSYAWDFGDGWTSSNPNPTHTYINAGMHYVSLLVMNSSACSDTAFLALNVTGVSCTANSNFSLVPTGTVQYWSAIPAYPWNVANAVWSWGDSSSTNGLYASHQYSVAGNYNICLSVTVSCGSTSSSCATYSVFRSSQSANIIYVNVAAPPGAIETGIAESQDAGGHALTVWPNPNPGRFTLRLDGNIQEPLKIHVYNLTGAEIYSETSLPGNGMAEKTIDLGSAAPGIYFIQLQAGNKALMQKIIVTGR